MSKKTRIISFWGKGGVGKTTCAASFAIMLAEEGKETFLITSDPTPSLSDIMDLEIGAKVTKVNGLSLKVIELDEETVIKLWKERFGDEVYRVVSSFFPVDKSIIDYVAGAPGIGDEFMLAYILDVYEAGEYDCIVWDTAPAGGTLRLLKIEEQFYKHLSEAAKLYLSLKSIIDKIKRGGRDPLEIISSWRRLAERVLDLISSPDFSAQLVTIPEWLGVAQTKRIINELSEFSVRVSSLIINQIIESEVEGLLAGKARIHEKYVELLEKTYRNRFKIIKIPMQGYEVRGIDALLRFSKHLEVLIEEV